jgi:UDP-N-acetyl-D-glucosamine dehydrogenase
VNLQMPYFVREKVLRTLNADGLALKGSRILAIGVAYKKDIEDSRESPALKVLQLLERDGAEIAYHDPYVPAIGKNGTMRRSVALSAEALASADCVVVLTDHSCIDWQHVVRSARRIVDTRNATRSVQARENVVLL